MKRRDVPPADMTPGVDDMLDEQTADRMLAGLVSAADTPPGYRPVAELLDHARQGASTGALQGDLGDMIALADRGSIRTAPRKRRPRARLVAIPVVAAMAAATGAAYAGVTNPVPAITHAISSLFTHPTSPAVGTTRSSHTPVWNTRYLSGDRTSSRSARGCTFAAGVAGADDLQTTCVTAASVATLRYTFAVPAAVTGTPTFSVDDVRACCTSTRITETLTRPARTTIQISMTVRGVGRIDIPTVSVGYYTS
jgi:hypothetical protein